MSGTSAADTPVYMIVQGVVTDPARMAVYAAALAASGLYARHGGHYITAGKALASVEAWPLGRSCVIAWFPSRAAAEAFWQSDTYQNDIKPLRAGAGNFEVALLAALPAPAGQS